MNLAIKKFLSVNKAEKRKGKLPKRKTKRRLS